ncbi:MAG: DNA-binding GntR family transcriptional regulator [Congregibacter sp.]|jgi:DNA-binding GntR family transcriptional regulator
MPLRQTVAKGVVDVLRERIISNKIRGGEPLRQDALALSLNVSRIPIREALLQLEAEGLVTFVPHKGAVATRISIDEVSEIFSLRALIECETMGIAIGKATQEDFEVSRKILSEFDRMLVPGADMLDWGRLNWKFHESLYVPSGNKRSIAIIGGLHTHCERFLRLQIQLSSDYERAEKEHHELLDLCRRRERAKAKKVLRDHIKTTGNELIRALSQHQ